jgi:protein-tyrosine phosphatase
MKAVLFVCTGNICRSLTAEGVFRKLLETNGLAESVAVDPASTGNWHVGESADGRACEAALKRGIDIADQRARQVQPEDFDRFAPILAMDQSHYQELRRLCLENQ